MVKIEQVDDRWLATVTRKLDDKEIMTAQYFTSLPNEEQISQLEQIALKSTKNRLIGRLSTGVLNGKG